MLFLVLTRSEYTFIINGKWRSMMIRYFCLCGQFDIKWNESAERDLRSNVNLSHKNKKEGRRSPVPCSWAPNRLCTILLCIFEGYASDVRALKVYSELGTSPNVIYWRWWFWGYLCCAVNCLNLYGVWKRVLISFHFDFINVRILIWSHLCPWAIK